MQLEICLNDVRANPLKYKPAYSCSYDMDIAPKLMTGGRRLPLNGADTVQTEAADKCSLALHSADCFYKPISIR
jgi:hypothetical protein